MDIETVKMIVAGGIVLGTGSVFVLMKGLLQTESKSSKKVEGLYEDDVDSSLLEAKQEGPHEHMIELARLQAIREEESNMIGRQRLQEIKQAEEEEELATQKVTPSVDELDDVPTIKPKKQKKSLFGKKVNDTETPEEPFEETSNFEKEEDELYQDETFEKKKKKFGFFSKKEEIEPEEHDEDETDLILEEENIPYEEKEEEDLYENVEDLYEEEIEEPKNKKRGFSLFGKKKKDEDEEFSYEDEPEYEEEEVEKKSKKSKKSKKTQKERVTIIYDDFQTRVPEIVKTKQRKEMEEVKKAEKLRQNETMKQQLFSEIKKEETAPVVKETPVVKLENEDNELAALQKELLSQNDTVETTPVVTEEQEVKEEQESEEERKKRLILEELKQLKSAKEEVQSKPEPKEEPNADLSATSSPEEKKSSDDLDLDLDAMLKKYT